MRICVAASAVLFTAVALVSAPWLQSESDMEIPHYNAAPPLKNDKLPPILTRDQLWGQNATHPYQLHAYELAAKIPKVIYQQPCYCYCDRSMHHNSLHSCFSGMHGAQCTTCMQELYYTYKMYKKGKTARQIRAGIIKGDFKTIDLDQAAKME
ncbi:MAG TPA: CYCXC family (seleno)protein [Terriglobales bacterium]|nr:CYCXC family (seleno)protein [Terriglobales bacterium]